MHTCASASSGAVHVPYWSNGAPLCLTGPPALRYCASPMNNHTDTKAPNGQTVLAREFTKRITRLGISRRELTKRTGLSRQTLHNIEYGGKIDLRPATLQALDAGLMWQPGTAYALSQGDMSVLDTADAMMHADKESAFRWRIVEKIGRMSLDDLERLVSVLESETFNLPIDDEPLSTDDVISRVESSILARVEERLREYRDDGGTNR